MISLVPVLEFQIHLLEYGSTACVGASFKDDQKPRVMLCHEEKTEILRVGGLKDFSSMFYRSTIDKVDMERKLEILGRCISDASIYVS